MKEALELAWCVTKLLMVTVYAAIKLLAQHRQAARQ